MEKQYYIISLKHTSKGDAALTFWGANGAGYTWGKQRAGLYAESVVKNYTSTDSIAVPQEEVDKFWMNALDFDDEYISVPNNPTVLHHLKLDQNLMKPKKYATCRMVFVNTPYVNQQ